MIIKSSIYAALSPVYEETHTQVYVYTTYSHTALQQLRLDGQMSCTKCLYTVRHDVYNLGFYHF